MNLAVMSAPFIYYDRLWDTYGERFRFTLVQSSQPIGDNRCAIAESYCPWLFNFFFLWLVMVLAWLNFVVPMLFAVSRRFLRTSRFFVVFFVNVVVVVSFVSVDNWFPARLYAMGVWFAWCFRWKRLFRLIACRFFGSITVISWWRWVYWLLRLRNIQFFGMAICMLILDNRLRSICDIVRYRCRAHLFRTAFGLVDDQAIMALVRFHSYENFDK